MRQYVHGRGELPTYPDNNASHQSLMRYVGLLCNCSMTRDPMEKLSPSLVNRAFLIDRLLRPDDIGVFLYSPLEVSSPLEVPGYTISGNTLQATRLPMPRVNANWTYGTRRMLKRGIGYNHFKRLLQAHDLRAYVPYAFAERVSNKRKAYDLVRTFDPALHPHTEDYSGAPLQVEAFLSRSSCVFIKPRSGNRGNGIFVLRPGPGGLHLTFYDYGGQRRFGPLTPESMLAVVQAAAGGTSYVIQEGVESLQAEGCVFDVRVVMVNDGSRWHEIVETRLAPPGSDLSNVFQGGSIEVTEAVLSRALGEAAAQQVLRSIAAKAHELARHLETDFPGELMEVGFDVVVDRHCGLHVVEINSKPGVAGFGSETRFFEWTPADEVHYRRWVQPHVTHLAAFLRAKLDEGAALSETRPGAQARSRASPGPSDRFPEP